MRVISASRRTDIPAFYSPWLFNRLRAGFCHWMNPFSGDVYRTSLAPDDVLALVLWTRDPRPMLGRLDELDDLGFAGHYYFHVTINSYGKPLDPHVAAPARLVEAFHRLSTHVGSRRVIWRYDPILFTEDARLDEAWHLKEFERLAASLHGQTDSCYFSFASYYGKTSRRIRAVSRSHGFQFDTEPTPERRLALTRQLRDIATAHGMHLYSCCGPEMLAVPGIRQGHCVDAALLQQLRPDFELGMKSLATRKGCGCAESTDIGAFDTCLFGCEYCYATVSHSAAQKRHRDHDPLDTILWRPSTMVGQDLTMRESELKEPKSKATPRPNWRQASLLDDER